MNHGHFPVSFVWSNSQKLFAVGSTSLKRAVVKFQTHITQDFKIQLTCHLFLCVDKVWTLLFHLHVSRPKRRFARRRKNTCLLSYESSFDDLTRWLTKRDPNHANKGLLDNITIPSTHIYNYHATWMLYARVVSGRVSVSSLFSKITVFYTCFDMPLTWVFLIQFLYIRCWFSS